LNIGICVSLAGAPTSLQQHVEPINFMPRFSGNSITIAAVNTG
jgi:hypothetical protein